MIYITRHGQTNWNVQKKVMGRCDEPLNETGLSQAEETRNNLMNTDIDLIICSPLKRARQTAEIINRDRNIPIIYDERIIERDFGEFEGMETKNFDFHGYWNYYKNMQFESAENIQVFFKRVYDFLEDITEKYKDKNVLLVAHGGISIPVACFFNGNIPEESLVDAGLVLGNCQVASYTVNNKKINK
ncbi:MAG: histidine phosphatase family protein [Bacilli bacterium]|nr:histidine phosphatase family protein [Bacilli bacterium]